MITKNQRMFKELSICAIEQGYSIRIENRIYLDLIVVLKLEEIINQEDGKEI